MSSRQTFSARACRPRCDKFGLRSEIRDEFIVSLAGDKVLNKTPLHRGAPKRGPDGEPFGRPDRRGNREVEWRLAVRIYVVCRADMRICEDELRDWLKPRLAHFKLPREIIFVEDLPRLGSGKLDRLELSRWASRAEDYAA